jgi:1,4-alpha-glucan branching enzyme
MIGRILALLIALIVLAQPARAERYDPVDLSGVKHPEWSKDAVIYQINTRQFTREGTFRAAQRELPRLKALGVDILWMMPIHPIGVKNRKGTLGSPYSVATIMA